MARIVENPNGRRLIRLTPEDVMSIVNRYVLEFRGKAGPSTLADLRNILSQNPFYLPED